MSQRLIISAIEFRYAVAFIDATHRHHRAPSGHKFSIGLRNEDGDLVGVCTVGKPVARGNDNGTTLEVTRLAVAPGIRNACSMLYAAAATAAQAIGYTRLVTYTLIDETETSLRAAGWECDGIARGKSWNTPTRPRPDDHPLCDKRRWIKRLTPTTSKAVVEEPQPERVSPWTITADEERQEVLVSHADGEREIRLLLGDSRWCFYGPGHSSHSVEAIMTHRANPWAHLAGYISSYIDEQADVDAVLDAVDRIACLKRRHLLSWQRDSVADLARVQKKKASDGHFRVSAHTIDHCTKTEGAAMPREHSPWEAVNTRIAERVRDRAVRGRRTVKFTDAELADIRATLDAALGPIEQALAAESDEQGDCD